MSQLHTFPTSYQKYAAMLTPIKITGHTLFFLLSTTAVDNSKCFFQKSHYEVDVAGLEG